MRTVFLLLSISSLIILLNSCEEPTEGCLDTFSSNYNLFADRECEDCCTYPSLSFTTSYLYGEDNNIDSSLYYQNSASSYFKLRSFYLVLSEFTLRGDNGEYAVRSKTEDKVIVDDLLGIRFKSSSNSPGSISIEDSIRTVDFRLGLPEGLDTPDDPDRDYELIEFLADSMYYDNGKYYKMIIEVQVDSLEETPLLLSFEDLDMMKAGSVVAGTTRGNRLNIQLSIDFMRLFNGIEFQSSNVIEEAKAGILVNIDQAIEVR